MSRIGRKVLVISASGILAAAALTVGASPSAAVTTLSKYIGSYSSSQECQVQAAFRHWADGREYYCDGANLYERLL